MVPPLLQTRLSIQLRHLAQAVLVCLLSGLALTACADEPDLVVYCSLDQEFGEPLIRQYEQETGLKVRVEFDVEANKNVGLALRVREERERPRCDVFWSNEFAMVVALAEDGKRACGGAPESVLGGGGMHGGGLHWQTTEECT